MSDPLYKKGDRVKLTLPDDSILNGRSGSVTRKPVHKTYPRNKKWAGWWYEVKVDPWEDIAKASCTVHEKAMRLEPCPT